MKVAVVTGGGGFVGTQLCLKLLESGYGSVIALDLHFITTTRDGVKRIQVIDTISYNN